jgi:hypothetical protein
MLPLQGRKPVEHLTLALLSFPMQLEVFCASAFLYSAFMQWMIPRSRGCNMPVQLAGKKTIFTSLQSNVFGGWAAHLSTNTRTFFPAAPILKLNPFKKFINIFDVIYTFCYCIFA